jgi:hypothetical protein
LRGVTPRLVRVWETGGVGLEFRSVLRWRMGPERAAAGGLEDVPLSDWPRLAARWLAAGFDSEPLRRLAGLRSGENRAAADLMPQALRSIGFDPSAGATVFMTRSQGILDVVQRDLDATGYGQYRMRPVNLSLEPRVAVYAALPDGRSWSGVGEGMTRRMDDADLLWHAAQSVSGTLAEVLGIVWPACAIHPGEPMAPSSDSGTPRAGIGGVVWWCPAGPGHAAAPVGGLTPQVARAR